MRWLHNMSQPPRTRIVAAGHRPAPRGVRIDLDAALPGGLPEDGPDWHQRLCAALGLDPGREGASGDAEAQAERALTRAVDACLERSGIPAALPLWEGPGRVACGDPILALAILSRASGRIFFARRRPRFDRERLARARVASEALLPAEVRR